MNLLSKASEYTHDVISKVEKITSLKISYKSLSPSILSAFYVKDIRLSDDNGTTVVKIDKVKLEYSLFKLLRGNFNEGFKSLSVDGVDVNIDAAIPVVKNFISNEKEKNVGFDFSSFKAELPLDFVVKNVSLSYTKNNFSANINLKKITTEYVQRKKQLNVFMNSFAKVSLNRELFTCNLGLTGNLFDGFEDSTATLTLSNLTSGTLKFNKLNLFLNFKEKVLTWATVQNTFPLRFTATYDTVVKKADVNLFANDFSIESVFASSGRNSVVRNLKDFKLTSDTKLAYDVSSRLFSYETESSVKLPSSILPGGAVAKVSANGDDKQLYVSDLSLSGDLYDVSSNLNLIYKDILLSGEIEVPYIILPNGTIVSTEIWFDPLKRGFMAFCPQFALADKSFTALELKVLPTVDSIDFTFEGYDYSHIDSNDPGLLSIEGSYLFASNYLQSSLLLNSLYLDSALDTVSLLIEKNKGNKISSFSKSVSDFMFSGDAYVSTDLSSVSFNIPYVLVANTKKDNQFLMLSLDGNEQSISLSQADLIIGKQAISANAMLDRMSDSKDMFFTLGVTADSIPYNFSGTYTNGLVRVYGDYNTEVEVNFDNKENLSGFLMTENFPIPVLGTSIVSSIDASFLYSPENGPEIHLVRFNADEAGRKFQSNPHIAISGNATKYGAQFNSITYTDLYSVLDGSADIVVNKLDGVFNSSAVKVNLNNPLSEESLIIEANISNPEELPFSIESVLKDFYIDSSVLINKFSLNRFTKINSASNEVTASLFFTGTLEHPYISAGIENASVMFSGAAMSMNASVIVEDREITVNEVNLHYRDVDVNNVSGSFSFDSFSGELKANLDALFLGETIHMPIFISVTDPVKTPSKLFPSSFTANISSDGIYGSFMKKNVAFSISAMYAQKSISIISSENIGLLGYYNLNGDFSAQVEAGDMVTAKMNGIFNYKTLETNIKISDIYGNLQKLYTYVKFDDIFVIYEGILKGALTLKGTLENPEFIGAMSIEKPNLSIPTVMPDHIFTDKILLTFFNSEINVPEKRFTVRKNNEVTVGLKIYFDRWIFEYLDITVKTDKNKTIPVNIKSNAITLVGDVDVDIGVYLTKHDVAISGNVFAEKAEAHFYFAKLVNVTGSAETQTRMFVNCDMNILFGNHVKANLDPLIRCVFIPNTELLFQYDQRTNRVVLDGNLGLKSGDVSYLNRNFYIKEGAVKFSETEEFSNPRITVRAETRERDEVGNTVAIILTADNQELQNFNPRFSSIPAKSENEIRVLLGQIVVADSTSVGTFLSSAGDYVLQSAIVRKVENSLRDFLNLDILSIRFNIIQNALSYGMDINNATTPGNLFDNSAVYIGKYLGSSLYVDAMVHFEYDDKRVSERDKWFYGVAFQPEFGFEFVSPFSSTLWNNDVLWNFNFRLNVAPDINALIRSQQFIPDTTLSLSWKFSF